MSSVPPGGPLGAPPREPEGTLVLRGAAHGLYRARRMYLISAIVLVVLDLAYLAVIVYLTLDQLHFDEQLHIPQSQIHANLEAQLLWLPEFLIFLITPAMFFAQWMVARRRERAFAETELWMSPYDVTYVCALGRFTAPSAAVRSIAFTTRPGPGDELRIDVENWGGPLQKLSRRGRPHTLSIPLNGADRRAVAQVVHAATGGQAVLNAG